jgi:hydroxymethylpyrimidine/phosphomethylpyrimidine kinase
MLPRALTIAGFDPSGGAGVLADARTFTAFGFHASAAITSITYQNTARVFGCVHQTGEEVRAQVIPLLEDAVIACAKTGMLPTRNIVNAVARLFRETNLPAPVVDPVIMSTSGHRLMEDNAVDALIGELLPLARLLTPNIPEAEQFTGLVIASEEEMREAAAKIRQMGARAVLIKGGHLKRQETGDRRQETGGRRQEAGGRRQEAGGRRQEAGGRRQKAENEEADEQSSISEEAIDVLDNEGKVTVFREKRILDVQLHGSGCILSAAIAVGLGRGMRLENSVAAAKSFVLEEIRKASRRGEQAQLQRPHTGEEA